MAEGIPTTVEMTLLDVAAGGAPLAGAAVYLWHWPPSAGSKLKTSQIALPKDTCELVYATEGYEQSVQNLAQTSLDTDNVFSDGYASQLATTSGTVDRGISTKLNVGV